MKWYHYFMCLLGGAFIANFFPHFVNGISGASFPTPFASPPPPVGKSPAPLNVAWALTNLAAGYLLLRYGNFTVRSWAAVLIAFAGFAGMTVMLANVFSAIPR
jgi:hypothetical protein